MTKVANLHLDSHNPRLPLALLGRPEKDLVRYLYETANLQELAESMADNGYFGHEPVLVVSRGGRTIVAEGNRRVATLLILLEDARAGDLEFPEVELTDRRREELTSIPVIHFETHDEVFKSLGFRHIGGIRTWSPEAKARYLYREVNDAVSRGTKEDPFLLVARRVGLDKQSVRQYFLAQAILFHASEELGVDTARLQTHDERRFGVWLRVMSSPDIREHMGLSKEAATFAEIQSSLRKLKKRQLQEVLSDIAPESGMPTLLPDSRKVTTYGRILHNEKAYAEMRRTGTLETASVIIDQEGLPVRLEKLARTLGLLAEEVLGVTKTDAKKLIRPAENIASAAVRLQNAVRGTAS